MLINSPFPQFNCLWNYTNYTLSDVFHLLKVCNSNYGQINQLYKHKQFHLFAITCMSSMCASICWIIN